MLQLYLQGLLKEHVEIFETRDISDRQRSRKQRNPLNKFQSQPQEITIVRYHQQLGGKNPGMGYSEYQYLKIVPLK